MAACHRSAGPSDTRHSGRITSALCGGENEMSSESRRMYVVAYDISDDSRRARVAKALESHGARLQYSVFTVLARPAKLIRLRDQLEALVIRSEDSIALFDLGIHDERKLKRIVSFIGVQ